MEIFGKRLTAGSVSPSATKNQLLIRTKIAFDWCFATELRRNFDLACPGSDRFSGYGGKWDHPSVQSFSQNLLLASMTNPGCGRMYGLLTCRKKKILGSASRTRSLYLWSGPNRSSNAMYETKKDHLTLLDPMWAQIAQDYKYSYCDRDCLALNFQNRTKRPARSSVVLMRM